MTRRAVGLRIHNGVCAGLLLAAFVLCAAAQAGIALRQTGSSPGKLLFFGVWGAAAIAIAVQRKQLPAVALCGLLAGLSGLGAAGLHAMKHSVSAVDLGVACLSTLVLTGSLAGYRLRARQTRGRS